MKYIVTFYAHFGAIRFKKLCEQMNIKAKIMPVPREKRNIRRRRPSLSGHRMRGNPLIPRCIACTAIFPICDFLQHTT